MSWTETLDFLGSFNFPSSESEIIYRHIYIYIFLRSTEFNVLSVGYFLICICAYNSFLADALVFFPSVCFQVIFCVILMYILFEWICSSVYLSRWVKYTCVCFSVCIYFYAWIESKGTSLCKNFRWMMRLSCLIFHSTFIVANFERG